MFTRESQIRLLRCADLNEDCISGENRFLAYLFLDKDMYLGLGININYGDKKYWFGEEILLKDSASYKQHMDFFGGDVLVIKQVDNTSNAETIIETVYWDLQKGFRGLKLRDGRMISIKTIK